MNTVEHWTPEKVNKGRKPLIFYNSMFGQMDRLIQECNPTIHRLGGSIKIRTNLIWTGPTQ